MEKINSVIQTLMVVDHNIDFFTSLNSIFIFYQMQAKLLNNGIDALKDLEKNAYDCFLLASELTDVSTKYLIDRIKSKYPWSIVIVMLENPTVEETIDFVPYGVDNFLIKPFTWENLEKVLTFYNY